MVYILLAPGFEEIEALAPADLLRRAGIETALVALEGDCVPGWKNITVKADLSLDRVELDKADMIVLPGGGVGVENLGKDARVEVLVKAAAEKGLWVAAICAAPTLLSRWGLLDGRKAVCYPTWSDRLTGADFRAGELLAVDGQFITGQAAGSAMDFGLKLVEVLAGAERAEEVRHGVCYR